MSGFYYFVPIPALPWEAAHQDGLVEVVEYPAAEGQEVDAGTAIAVVANRWAVMQIEATGRGVLSRTFFDRGTWVRVGDPIAIVTGEGEDMPYEEPQSTLRILHIKRRKPPKRRG